MGYVPTPEEAFLLVKQYNRELFHLEHARTVAGIMGYFARKHDPEREDFWRSVGMLHDVDFELYPEEHCVKAREILTARGIDEALIHAVVSHGWGICSEVEPELYMEKVLYAVDELSGLIGAAALMRPTGLADMEVKSVAKKFKDKKFAAGCSREVICRGAEMLGMELPELFGETLRAMQSES